MSTLDESGRSAQTEREQLPEAPDYLAARAVLAESFLFGEGLEIGPLHQPLAIPRGARARYVDRMPVEQLRREYPELATWDLTEPDIIDDGETLATVTPESQDFVVANHFLEHTEDPIGTILTHLSKLRPGGILFYAVPDKRYTFDFRRPATPLEHMVADHDQGPERSRREHYEEWSRLVIEPDAEDGKDWRERATELETAGYSIHMHTWDEAEFLRLVLECRERSEAGFDLAAAAHRGLEFIVVLRKRGPLPEPGPDSQWLVRHPPSAPPRPDPGMRRRIRRALQSAKREIVREY